ncbi:MAG: class II glutamine amidotransferase, partial [Thermoguttaceae bacterium]
MCGIVGYVGSRNAVDFLVGGLRRLEYRGYDSSGVASITPHDDLVVVKGAGRIDGLEARLNDTPAPGCVGIGHTRWATHGEANDVNAHPHIGGHKSLALVHNGVIENFQAIKRRLVEEGYQFASDTDSEVIAQLIDSCLARQPDIDSAVANDYKPLLDAVQEALSQLQGTYGVAIVFRKYPQLMIAA